MKDTDGLNRPDDCECDNGHEQAETCCMPCWNAGFRKVANYPSEETNDGQA